MPPVHIDVHNQHGKTLTVPRRSRGAKTTRDDTSDVTSLRRNFRRAYRAGSVDRAVKWRTLLVAAMLKTGGL